MFKPFEEYDKGDDLVKITFLSILPYPWPKKELPNEILYLDLVRMYSLTNYTVLSLYTREYTDNERRYFTLAAAVNGRYIPNSLVLIDDETRNMAIKYIELTATPVLPSEAELVKYKIEDISTISEHMEKYDYITKNYVRDHLYYSAYGMMQMNGQENRDICITHVPLIRECITVWGIKNNKMIETEFLIYNNQVKTLLLLLQ